MVYRGEARVEPGDRLEGFCDGAFGRDFYGGVVESVGRDWVLARESDGNLYVAQGEGIAAELVEYVEGEGPELAGSLPDEGEHPGDWRHE